MLTYNGAQIRFDPSSCNQCGMCLSACNLGALRVGSDRDGFYHFDVDEVKCTRCLRCVDVCPAKDVRKRPLTEEQWRRCRSAWLGWSLDPTRRFSSSSGGVARTLIEYALASGLCDAVWCVGKPLQKKPPCGVLLRGGDDLSVISNSIYEPVLAMAGLPRLPRGTRLLAVGTNCQLQGLDNLVRNRVHLLKVAIFCKQQKTSKFASYLRRKLRVEAADELQYRGSGWPGLCRAGSSSAKWERVAALPFGRGLWRLPGCRTCTNPIGFDADITLSDPWSISGFASPAEGSTLMLIRTRQGEDIVTASEEGLGLLRLSIDRAKVSMDWKGIKAKQRRLAFYLGTEQSIVRRLVYAAGECQRRLYEELLERVQIPQWCLRVLNRLPFLG